MNAAPLVGSSSVTRMRMVVVLPAPLGPMKPKMSPAPMCRSRLSTATRLPKVFVSFLISIMAPHNDIASYFALQTTDTDYLFGSTSCLAT